MISSDDEAMVGTAPIGTTKASEARPTLLPAFEPCSSSPSLPRPSKRKYDGSPCDSRPRQKFYPTPVPTSCTGILPSSPPQPLSTRPELPRTTSILSERVPLGALPSIKLAFNGEPTLMGRSSNSSHYQLSANRLISRIHVSATYRAADQVHEYGEVLIECLGWNGAKVHCQGKAYELGKGHTFSSDKPQAEIMLDVQHARVLIEWPTLQRPASLSASPNRDWDDEDSPVRGQSPSRFASSPPRALIQLQSPVSPSPRDRASFNAGSTFLGLPAPHSPTRGTVEVYEDEASGADDDIPSAEPQSPEPQSSPLSKHTMTPPRALQEETSLLSEIESLSDNDEENDPIIHSFGPFGDNLQSRMASITAGSPQSRRRAPLEVTTSPGQSSASASASTAPVFNASPIRNHVINQLAFSRLHSLPLSTIMNNLPASLKGGEKSAKPSGSTAAMGDGDLKSLLDAIPCVGEIAREGKDAAGKALEDEFYYVPEKDSDEMRRNAVEQKPGLRAVRKQHKQYYWKRPRF